MSSSVSRSGAPVPVPRTGVPLGITDPVEQARAELKAALAAIEIKANIPKRIAHETEKATTQARAFVQKNPVAGVAAVVGAAVAVGALVWGAVRLYVR
jgi:ElaB/YqjD/DUF883 family membrane-anchored ribosome-binding protein